MKYNYLLLLIGIILTHHPAQAQIDFNDPETDEFYIIEQGIDQAILDKYLRSIGAVDIEFNKDPMMLFDFPFKVKTPKGQWKLISTYGETDLKKIKSYDSIGFPFYSVGERLLIAVKNKGYYGLIDFDSKKNPKPAYDQIRSFKSSSISYDSIDIFLGKKEGKWGQFWMEYEVVPFIYSSWQEVPFLAADEYVYEAIAEIRKKNNLDKLEVVGDYGYTLKGRDAKTGKWGVFEGEGSYYYPVVPTVYDSVRYHPELQLCEVWNNGKVGYYEYDLIIAETVFDDLEFVNLDYFTAAALKRDGLWQFYDLYEQTLIFEDSAETIDELVSKWLNRNDE